MGGISEAALNWARKRKLRCEIQSFVWSFEIIDLPKLRKALLVTHGNAADQIHAPNWLLHDLFFTADRAFYSALEKIATLDYAEAPRPVFIDRSGLSCVTQIEANLKNAIVEST